MNREQTWYKMESNREKVLPASIRTMSNALTKAIQPALDDIPNYSATPELIERAPEKVKRSEIEQGYIELYTGVMPKFAKLRFRALKKSVNEDYILKQDEADEMENLWIRQAKRYVQEELPERITGVTGTTQQKVRDIISKGIEEGMSIPDIAKNIDELGLPDIVRNRSQLIARTETVNASNRGDIQGARATKLDLNKEWLATQDSRVRIDHSNADGQRVAMDASFTVGGYSADYPGDPSLPVEQVANCRCTTTYVTKG